MPSRDERGETEREQGPAVSYPSGWREPSRSTFEDRYGESRERGRSEYDEPWDRQHSSGGREYQGEPRYGGAQSGQGYGGQNYGGYGGGSRNYEEAGGYTGGHRNAWNDSARGGWEQHRGAGSYGGAYGRGVRSGNTLRWGEEVFGASSSGYSSPFDEQNRSSSGSYGSLLRDRGPFAGRGPKGYQRSDDRIREDVCERLTYDPDIDASDVTVSVSNGEVTLSGEVENRHQKRLAEDLIEDVNGVKDVHNRLSARRGIIGTVVDEVTGRTRDENNVGKGPRTSS